MLRDRNPQHWKLWVFYYNHDEPRVFVTKRLGWGFTLNFARPMAWAIVAATIAIMASGAIVRYIHFLR